MVRFILAVLACSVSVGAKGEIVNAPRVFSDEGLALLADFTADPEDLAFLQVFGAMWHTEGDWEDGTLEVVGHFHPLTGGGERTAIILPEEIRIPLPRTHGWVVEMNTQLGVMRGRNGREPYIDTVGLMSLNAVRNDFGVTGPFYLGDVNFDDTVDISDLNIVRNTFGNFFQRTFTLPNAAPVPEPPGLTLLIPGLFALSMLRGRSRSRS